MIGQNIKQIRKKQGYSQEDIAKLLHIKTSIINLWEKGDGIPSLQHVLKLSEILKVPCDEILLGKIEILYLDQLTEEQKNNVRIIYNSFLKLNNMKDEQL